VVSDAAQRPDQVVVYWMRQVRPFWVTGPPSVSSRPCRTASRTLTELYRYRSGTNLVAERVPFKPRRRATAVTGFSRVMTSPGDVTLFS